MTLTVLILAVCREGIDMNNFYKFCPEQIVLSSQNDRNDHSTKCKEMRQFINSLAQLLKETGRCVVIVPA